MLLAADYSQVGARFECLLLAALLLPKTGLFAVVVTVRAGEPITARWTLLMSTPGVLKCIRESR